MTTPKEQASAAFQEAYRRYKAAQVAEANAITDREIEQRRFDIALAVYTVYVPNDQAWDELPDD
jgi:hypothetical protein